MKGHLKNLCIWVLVLTMILPGPMTIFAQVNYQNLDRDKDSIINGKAVNPAKPDKGKTAADLIKNPDQPAIYTLRTDYKVQRGEKYDVNYQPYIASVGAAATQAEKDKVKKTIDLPDLTGYEKPEDNFTIYYDTVKNAADGKGETGDATNGIRYQANEDFHYKAKSTEIKIKHVFQDLEDFTKYTNPDGSVGETGELITTQQGNTGSTMEVSPLKGNDVKGFVPEASYINMQVPENAENFILEYRYNRAHYDVTFDTEGGTEIPTRTLYYEQEIPKIADAPTKVGGEFQGWKPSVELKGKSGTHPADQIIKNASGQAILNLDDDLIMPPSNVNFTAVWKDNEKADYAVQFWAEKADHADNAGLEKYDYIGTRVYKDQATGSRPDLDNEPVKDIVFPDLDQKRLQKIWAGDKFYADKYLYLNKFYVYNKDITHDQNKDPKNVNLVKSVDATGKTVYNIYYDRQVYDLYFTKSNALPAENTFYPEIYVPDGEDGAKLAGGPGNLYHYKARFNQLMLGWPNDAMQTKGFTPGKQSYGWGPNYGDPHWPLHLDTPPYRLNADEFLDMPNYDNYGGYVNQIDKGDGTFIDVKNDPRYKEEPYKALSFGIKQENGSMPHHMDFWMDGFKPGETIIRYDLYRSKADTNSLTYGHKYSHVQGFTPYGTTIEEGSEEHGRITEDDIDELNNERGEITPYPNKDYTDTFGFNNAVGQMHYIKAFFNNADEFGDPLPGIDAFNTNGYIRFKYKRNKYPLRFNSDPSKTKDDSEFNDTNQLQTFYEFPLKALNPEVDTEESYKTGNPKNILDNPEKLKELGLTDLVFTDADGKLKVKRPDNLSDQMVFKGWALDPAGTKLIWENPKETMPTHPVHLFAKWGEPDYKWKVTFDPDGGSLKNIKEESLTQKRKTIQEGDIGQEEVNTYAKKEANDGNKQVFTVIQRQKLVEPKFKPTKKGYDFMGWEVIRYKKDPTTGDYTNEIDNSYRETYKVPELYSFGNDVVSPIYLKAIWVPNQRVDVDIEHYFLDNDYKLDTKINPNPGPDKLEDKRAGYLVATTGDKQDEHYILAPHSELEEKLTGDLAKEYKEYNDRVKGDNTFFQQFRVEPAQILNKETNKLEDNPKVTDNVFKFFYRPYRQREYKVNYIDERFKENPEKGKIIDPELVTNGNRHYDARNYRRIPGWVLAKDEKPQQQLFFDVNEETNEFLGINGTGKKEITFYYKDVRVIEVPKDGNTPDGYVRVTFKADKGGSFGKDAQGKDITELHYDVIKGLKSDLLPVPGNPVEESKKEAGKYYITPETGKKFVKWDNKLLLNANTIINENHTFTAYFEWSGLSASGLVRTEAFKDPNGKWTNDFAPTIDQLKKQLVWKEKDVEKPLPAGAVIKLFDEAGKELTEDKQVYDLVNEQNKADKDQLVRTVKVKAKVTFTNGKDPQELDIPITVYKNVYEALTAGEKPLFLSEAEKGELKDITGNYVKVTVNPTGKPGEKDSKIYYVNPKAWVEIPEIILTDAEKANLGFTNWTADQAKQNEKKEANGVYDFTKRHMFTDEATVISPGFSKDVVPQEGKDKPKVPDNYVEVIVKTTDNATDETKFEKTFWVNPSKEVTLPVVNPTGKSDQEVDIPGFGKKKVTYIFKNWQKVEAGETDDSLTEVNPVVIMDLAKSKFTDKVTIIEAAYKKSIQAEKIEDPLNTNKLDVPQGKKIEDKDLIEKITPQEGKIIDSIIVVENPDTSEPGSKEAKVIVNYKDGSIQGSNDNPVIIPVEVHKNIIPEVIPGQKPEGAMDNYVKVTFEAGTGGTVSGNLVYYVSPEVEVDMTDSANAVTKTPSVGYTSNGGTWSPEIKAEKITNEKTYEFNFVKSKDIVEKTDDPSQVIPEGYVTVIFKTEDEAKGKLEGNLVEKVYFVNPVAGIKLVELADGQAVGDKELAVPKTLPNIGYEFTGWVEPIDKENSITGNKTYVAQFSYRPTMLTLTYQAGGGNGEPPSPQSAEKNQIITLAGPNGLRKDNAAFQGWKIGDKIYGPGERFTLTENTTAIAVWANNGHTVYFNTVGGSYIAPKTVEHGKLIGPVTPPSKENFTFTGWTLDGGAFDPTKDVVNANMTLVAQYKPSTSVPGITGHLVTEEGVQPTPDQYKNKITPPTGKTIDKVEIVGRPDVSKPGVSTADLKVTYTDGTSSDVKMTVFVQRKPQTDWQTGTLGPTRTVTVVEKEIVKVPAEKIFRKEVRYMQGYNNYFRPTEGLTRAEAAQILANALVEDGYRYDPNFAIHYKDIVGNEWYAKAIRITSQANVFKGYDTGYFDPHKKITRAEWIGTLRRFQELERVSGNHMQVRADHWAMGEIEAAYKEGWLAIYGQGLAKFRADEFIPRQEVAAVSNKAFNRVLDKTYIHRNSKNLINYKDVNPSMWSYEDILCASNGYIHDGKSFWGHKIDYKKDLYNINLDGYTVTKDKFQRLERR